MEIYLDNSATTMVAPEVREEMMAALGEAYGNPSSLHRMGAEAEQLAKTARERVAAVIKADSREIFFTSGGTEANNLALLGGARAKKREGNHVIISSIEHPSVSAAAEELEKEGFSVTRLAVTRDGLIDPACLMLRLNGRQPAEVHGASLQMLSDSICILRAEDSDITITLEETT